MSKPKQNVWVVFNSDMVPIAVEFLGSNATRIAVASDTIVRYTPAKPAKACRWPSLEGGTVTGCDAAILAHHSYKFCPYCGGKIKVMR